MSDLKHRIERAVETAADLSETTRQLMKEVKEDYSRVDLVHQLEQKATRRDIIGMAKGMLMATFDIDEHMAFEFLRRASQRQHRKLFDIAQEMVHCRCLRPVESEWQSVTLHPAADGKRRNFLETGA